MTTPWLENWTTVYLCGAVAVLFLVHYFWVFTKLRRCGIPGPTPLPVFGTLLSQIRLGIHQSFALWTEKYGKVFGCYNGPKLAVVVTDPELLKRIFVKDFNVFVNRQANVPLPKLLNDGLFFLRDDHWKITRNIVSPTFSSVKLREMIDIMNKCAETLSSNLVKEANTKQAQSIKDNLSGFSLDVIASTAFGLEIDSQNQPDAPLVRSVRSIFDTNNDTRALIRLVLSSVIPGFMYIASRLSLGPLNKATDYMKHAGLAIITDRKKHQTGRVDFLQLLINAEYTEDQNGGRSSSSETAENSTSGSHDNGHQIKTTHRLTDDSINAQTFLFFLAGYETTSSLLRYATYVLATRPDIDESLVDEIKDVLGDAQPTYDGLAKLKYMEMFINETLRFYPPLPRLAREASQDIHYGDITIPMGCDVIIPALAIHHNPEFYPDPEVFDPERFSAANKSRINPVTFIPFGYGPRNCIGMRLALVEAKLALVHMLRRLRFVRTAETVEPLTFKPSGLLNPVQPIKIGIELRPK